MLAVHLRGHSGCHGSAAAYWRAKTEQAGVGIPEMGAARVGHGAAVGDLDVCRG
ncbi:hypothetical protein AB0C34_09850 [Nocardia sp. NPDC049220]|uniref:hypothetical protein n=1 Tax=Nocardia sp. NPDC049220 TaxID=3155273 RepID=UPI0033D9CDE8